MGLKATVGLLEREKQRHFTGELIVVSGNEYPM
jgi:hypothetical protein